MPLQEAEIAQASSSHDARMKELQDWKAKVAEAIKNKKRVMHTMTQIKDMIEKLEQEKEVGAHNGSGWRLVRTLGTVILTQLICVFLQFVACMPDDVLMHLNHDLNRDRMRIYFSCMGCQVVLHMFNP